MRVCLFGGTLIWKQPFNAEGMCLVCFFLNFECRRLGELMLRDRQNLWRKQLLKEWGTGLSLLSWHPRLIRICSTGKIVNLVSVPEVLPWTLQYKGPECLSSQTVRKTVPYSATQAADLRGEYRFGVVKKGQSRRLNFFYKGNNLVNFWEGSEITIVLLKLYFVI